jgi:hypothetical protein
MKKTLFFAGLGIITVGIAWLMRDKVKGLAKAIRIYEVIHHPKTS